MEDFSSYRKETNLYGWIVELTLKDNNEDGNRKGTGNIVKETISVG